MFTLSYVEYNIINQNRNIVNDFYKERKIKYNIKRSSLNKKYRKLLLKTYKRCPVCNSTKKPELVHIIGVARILKWAESLEENLCFNVVPIERVWDLAYHKANMIILCHQCHRLLERPELLWSEKTLKLLKKKRELGSKLYDDVRDLFDWCKKFNEPCHEVWYSCGYSNKYPNCISEKNRRNEWTGKGYKCPYWEDDKNEIDYNKIKKELNEIKLKFNEALENDKIKTTKRREKIGKLIIPLAEKYLSIIKGSIIIK